MPIVMGESEYGAKLFLVLCPDFDMPRCYCRALVGLNADFSLWV